MSTKQMVYYDDQLGFPACFQTAATTKVRPGFVNIVSGSNYVIQQTTQSGTKSPIGIITTSAASGTTGIEVRDRGYVWLNTMPTAGAVAGKPVFPTSGTGHFITTGKSDASGNAILGNRGFGTVIKGAASASDALVKLERM